MQTTLQAIRKISHRLRRSETVCCREELLRIGEPWNRIRNTAFRAELIRAEVHIGDLPPPRLPCTGEVVEWMLDALVAVLTEIQMHIRYMIGTEKVGADFMS
ncbi:hypothetical protein CHS0354_040532 [Potamilus streckersoni]|uniref:Uncharacterized protein n=1 Tax=Potamilus streckersoni TaxID=2493646 RepID=A0AAE0T272_9BIVA|nr:hypothetical protein CHS0354_040532 [Potamilus streckersoni]